MRHLTIGLFFLSQIAFTQTDNTVEAFLTDQINNIPSVRDLTLSSDGQEAYFSAQSPLGEVSVILSVKRIDNAWSTPQIASFSGEYHDLEPFLSPDGLQLYFVSNRPLDSTSKEVKDYDIWYVERNQLDEGWSAPVNMGSPVNSTFNEFYPAITDSKNLYFTCDLPSAKGRDDIFMCAWENDHYAEPTSLSEAINSEGYEFNAFVAPDESFLIFSGYNRKDGLGSGDLYISYRDTTGGWTEAKNLGESINSAQMDYCPFVDLASNTLYFTSKRSNVEALTQPVESLEKLEVLLNNEQNGKSKLYRIKEGLKRE